MGASIPRFERSKSKIDAYSREVLRLQREAGRELKPAELVRSAKAKASPLHRYFDWSDTVAAERWRVHQARLLICNVRIIVKSDSGRNIRARALWSVRVRRDDKVSRGYVDVQEVRKEPTLRIQVLNEALDDLEEWLRRYATYGEFSTFRAFLKAKVAELRSAVNNGSDAAVAE